MPPLLLAPDAILAVLPNIDVVVDTMERFWRVNCRPDVFTFSFMVSVYVVVFIDVLGVVNAAAVAVVVVESFSCCSSVRSGSFFVCRFR